MPRWTRWAAYWTVVLASAGFAAYVVLDQRRTDAELRESIDRDPRPAVTSAPSSPPSAPTRRALLVGDGYLAGPDSFGRQACAALAWRCRFDARAGSGYAAGADYAGRLGGGRTVDVVVVTGGRSDVGRAGVRAAVRGYLAEVKERYPRADVVVVEPFWNDDVAYDAVTQLRAEVKAAAEAADAGWVPSAGWLSGSEYFADGGADLTEAGARQLADRLSAALRE